MNEKKSTNAHIRAVEKYNAKNYDRLTFRVKKEDTERIKKAVDGGSINGFIYNAVMEKIERMGL